jgi:sialate O-acetylesterase
VNVISKAANTPSVSTPTTGGIEFWSNCYSQGTNGVFDYDDTITVGSPDCYGSLQLSIGTNMVFSYNRWSSGGNSDMGFGNQPTGNPDWTFAQNSASFATRRLEVYIK